MKPPVRPSDWVIMASGAMGFLLTLPFMHWYTFSDQFQNFGGAPEGISAWNVDGIGDAGGSLFPLATYVPLIFIALTVLVGLKALAGVQMPPQVLDVGWPQIYLGLSIFAVLLCLGFLGTGTTDEMDFGAGFWFGAAASLGLLVGSIMAIVDARRLAHYLRHHPQPYPGPPPPQP